MQILKSTIGFLIGIVPGVIYYQTDMVGIPGTLFLIGVGGFIGLALSWPTVSSRRVIHEAARATPLLWPLAAVVPKPDPEPEVFSPPPPAPRPVSPIELKWLTTDVMAIARAICFDSKLELLPVLGDALLEAGCENSEYLNLCFAGQWNDQTRRFIAKLLSPIQID